MDAINHFLSQLSNQERAFMETLNSPFKIQAFLDEIKYPSGDKNRSPLQVLRDGEAHCLDGGLFAATALQLIGFPPMIIDLQPEPERDDDHVLALYRIDGFWGAVAKSNFNGLRFREAIFRTTRELALSYFEDFFNVLGEKTLRSYSRIIRLESFDHLNWMVNPAGVDAIERYLKRIKTRPLISPDQAQRLSPVSKRSFAAGTLGINLHGVYSPK